MRSSLLLLALLAFEVSAQCFTSDLAGSWRGYQVFIGQGWQHCGLRIRTNGSVEGGVTNCEDLNGVRSMVTGGQLQVAGNCKVTGRISNDFGPMDISSSFLDPYTNTWAGVGWTSLPVYFHVIRRSE